MKLQDSSQSIKDKRGQQFKKVFEPLLFEMWKEITKEQNISEDNSKEVRQWKNKNINEDIQFEVAQIEQNQMSKQFYSRFRQMHEKEIQQSKNKLQKNQNQETSQLLKHSQKSYEDISEICNTSIQSTLKENKFEESEDDTVNNIGNKDYIVQKFDNFDNDEKQDDSIHYRKANINRKHQPERQKNSVSRGIYILGILVFLYLVICMIIHLDLEDSLPNIFQTTLCFFAHQSYYPFCKRSQNLQEQLYQMQINFQNNLKILNEKIDMIQRQQQYNIQQNEIELLKELRNSKYLTRYNNKQIMLLLYQSTDNIKKVVEILNTQNLNEIPVEYLDFDKKYNNGLTLVEYCFYKKQNHILNYIYKNQPKDKYKDEEYFTYCQEGNFTALYTLIQNGIDIEQKYQHEPGFTCLAKAVLLAHKSLIDLFIQSKANLNTKFGKGMSLIFFAIKQGSLDLVKKLAKNGANINLMTEDGLNPFTIACADKKEEIIKFLLLQPNIDISAKNLNLTGLQSLHQEDKFMYERVIQFINRNNINVDHADI